MTDYARFNVHVEEALVERVPRTVSVTWKLNVRRACSYGSRSLPHRSAQIRFRKSAAARAERCYLSQSKARHTYAFSGSVLQRLYLGKRERTGPYPPEDRRYSAQVECPVRVDCVEKVGNSLSSRFTADKRSRIFYECARAALSKSHKGAAVEENSTIPRLVSAKTPGSDFFNTIDPLQTFTG